MDGEQRRNDQTPDTGRWGWQLTGTSWLNQWLAGLPNGTYTLSVWVAPAPPARSSTRRGFGRHGPTTSIAAATAWTNLTVTGVTVSNGRCDIGVTTSGQTVTVDDFVLSRG